MSELPVPDYIAQRLKVLRDEKLRIEGRIAELEVLAQSLSVKEPSD
jgi:hypothetical protein